MAKKILIVDDDKEIALLLASRLKANKYEAVVAYDAVEAVAKAFRERPDLILLDIKMPAGGGLRVMHNLRNAADTATIPVIVITAYPSQEIQQKVKEMGSVNFIAKPFKAENVLSKIRRALGEVHQEGGVSRMYVVE
jgi:two-component system KDP operon response regulator KdpE